jgi:nitronate monooxygenase
MTLDFICPPDASRTQPGRARYDASSPSPEAYFMARWQTLLGTEWPIIQAPMADVQGSALAIAVACAGGLGSVPAAMLDAATLRAELARLSEATPAAFNINFFCHRPPPSDAAREARWRERLAPYYRELGLSEDASTPAAARRPFDAEALAVLADFKPRVVSFHFGLPDEDLLAPLRAWGATIMASATTVDEARWLAARGADVIIAQGLEAGGHRGHFLADDLSLQMGTFALLPQVVRAVDVPVVAAGGVADAAGVRAALALGASGVQVGTAYLLCPEATTSPLHRAALHSAAAAHTALTNLYSGRPARGIVTRLMRELGPISDEVPAFPLASAALAPLRARAEAQGRAEFSPLRAGQNTSGCKPVPAAQLTRELALGCAACARPPARHTLTG